MERAFLVAALVAGCGAPPLADRAATPVRREAEDAPRVVLITLDGARWQEIVVGVDPAQAARRHLSPGAIVDARRLLPHVYTRLIDRGVALVGPSAIEASGPNYVSLPGYREILTGRPARGCASNDCPPLDEPTLLDELRARDDRERVAAIASWEVIEQAAAVDTRAITVSTGRRGGGTRDLLRVDETAARLLDHADGPWPGHGDYRRDRDTAELALDYLAARRPSFLFVGLGDTDEYAHRDDYRGYLAALTFFDDFVERLFALLDSLDDGGRTIVLATADHGRARTFRDHGADPDSRAVWLLAAGGGIPSRGVATPSRGHRLADVAPTVRRMLALVPDRAPGAGAPIVELLPDGDP